MNEPLTDQPMPASNSLPNLKPDTEVMTLVGLAHAVSHFFQLAIPPLYPWLMHDFSLSFTSVGLLMTVFFVVSAAGQALAGFLVDRFGARSILALGLALLGLSGLLLADAHDVSMLFVAAAVAGLGNSVFHPADYTLINRLVSPERLTRAFSVHALTGTLGWAAAPIFVFGLASASTWRTAAMAAAAVAFVPLVLVLLRRSALQLRASEGSGAECKDAPQAKAGAFGFLAAREVWMCFGFFFCWTMAFSALQNFAPPILSTLYALSLTVATSSVSAYLAGSAAGTLSAGFSAPNASPDRAVAVALSLGVVVALLLASASVPAAGVVPLMAVMGFGVGYAAPSRDMLVRQAAISGAGPAAYGRIYGFVYCGLDAGLALSPLLFGRFMDAAQFAQVMWGVALFQGLAIVTALRVGGRLSPAVPRA